MADTAPNTKPEAMKRRSTRIVQAVPVAVSGIDALGRPFEERTSTSVLNCHGCRYQSKHYVLKNMWVTLEIPNPEQGRPPRSVRARVMWIQRPRTVRELFQVGVELEVPGNIWGIAFCPPDWFPFPESGIHVAAPPVQGLPEGPAEAMPSENASWSDATPDFAADNVRTMPLAPQAGTTAEATSAPAQLPAQVTAETREQLRAEVRDYAAEAVAAEARRLLESLQNQLQEASDKAAQAATEAAAEKAIQSAMAKSEALAEERMRAVADRLNDEFGRSLDQRFQKLAAQSGEIDPARREAMTQQLQTQLNEGLDQMRAGTTAAANEFQTAIAQSRENLEKLRREMEESASVSLQDGVQRLKAQAGDAQARVAELESVQRQLIAESRESLEKLRREMDGSVSVSAQDGVQQLKAQADNAQARVAELENVQAQIISQSRENLEKLRREMDNSVSVSLQNGLQQLKAQADNAQARMAELENAQAQIIGQSRENLEKLRREMDDSVSASLQDGVQRLKAQADDARARVAELENVQRQVIDKITSVFASAETDWQARLQASTVSAVSSWDQQLAASSERAAQQLAERAAVSSIRAREQFENELSDRVAASSKALQDASAEAEGRLSTARVSFDNQIAQVQTLFSQVQSSAQALGEQVRQIEAAHQTAEGELRRRAATLVELHSQELVRSGESAVAAWTSRLQPSLEAAGQQTIAQLGAQFEQQLSSQLGRASSVLGQLENQSLAAEQLARKLEEELTVAFARSAEAASAELQKRMDVVGNDFQELGQGSVQRWLAEVETKANETTHAAFESLFKTADWYEKKVQTQMQSVLDKGLEQGVNQLREKAGEISRVFAGELDHYSRSYVEHTQGQIEEVARDAQERAKKLSQELTVSTVYATSQQLQSKTESAVGELHGKLSTALSKAAVQIEDQVSRTRGDVEALAGRISADFGAAIAHQTKQALGTAREELISHTQIVRDRLRSETEESEKQLREVLSAASDQGIEAYKQRLESAANSWLLTTVSKLNQQSNQQLDVLTHTAEARLNETCKQVFARMGETLHRQMLDLSPAPPAAAAPSPKDPADQQS